MGISALVYPHYSIGPTDRGPGVLLIQRALDRLGYEVPQDGEFKEETEYAIRQFQGAASLEETGLVNVETAAAIDAAIHKLVASGRNSTKE